jgi:molybdopterin-containing oxidoreductase family membrane subunit
MWASAVLAFAALVILIIPRIRRKEGWLAVACAFVFVSLWIEKGLGLVVTGFIPSPLETITEYVPTGTEIAITLGIWAVGFLILTLLYRIFVAVRSDIDGTNDRSAAKVKN